ncbi:pentatricopeptide repeat-containing protein At4g30700-like [Wolffia australiana]
MRTKLVSDLCLFLKRQPVIAAVVHGLALRNGLLISSIFLCNNVIHAYVAQPNFLLARRLFDDIPHRNFASFSIMISGLAKADQIREAASFFINLRRSRDEEDDHDCASIIVAHAGLIKGCGRMGDFRTGVQLHCSSFKLGLEFDSFLATALMDLYRKCGEIEECKKVFDGSPHRRDSVIWTTLISAYLKNSKGEAFALFNKMVAVGVWPTGLTFSTMAKSLDEPCKLSQAKQLHVWMTKMGIIPDEILALGLVTMYGKCGGVDELARLSGLGDPGDILLSTSLMMGFLKNGFSLVGIQVFREMIRQAALPDGHAMAAAIGAFSDQKLLRLGEEAHGYSLRRDLISNSSVGVALIKLYSEFGLVQKAKAVFMVKVEEEACFTAILSCYMKNGILEEALGMLKHRINGGWRPDAVTATVAVTACAALAATSAGEQVHSLTIKLGYCDYLSLENSLITMYGKCGDLASAEEIFGSIESTDDISWNSMIDCYAHHGFGREAIVLFYKMQVEGFKPDDYTFLGVLTGCSHAGLVEEAREFFKKMKAVYQVEPKAEHWACMVDLLGRAGRLEEAFGLAATVGEGSSSPLMWQALLGACSIHGDIKLGSLAMEKLTEMKREKYVDGLVVLSNISAAVGAWEGKAAALAAMRQHGLRKDPAISWVEINGRIYAFSPNDQSHPELFCIYWKLEELRGRLEEMGYVAETQVVHHDTSREEREVSLLRHSEKLALAFVLVATAESKRPIKIMQNLRCCVDCHTVMKLVSKIEGRLIIFRDSKRFHTFEDGNCSCGDY